MHLTIHTNSRGCWKLCLATHIFSLSVSLCCSLSPNWSSWSDNPALSALISSQACLSVTDWNQMTLLREDNTSSKQKGRQLHANLKPWTLNHAEHPGNGSVILKRDIMDVFKQMRPGSANLHSGMQTADDHMTSHRQAEVGVHTTVEGFNCSLSNWLQKLLLFISYSLSGLSFISHSSLSAPLNFFAR